MARIRSLHPGQATDEDFVELSPAAMFACVMLRCHADDNGVFEWKPKGLKMKIYPAANVDMDALLDEMLQHQQVCRFEHDGRSYGAIRNFLIWQRPQKPKSLHPLPPEIAEYVGVGRAKSRKADGADIGEYDTDGGADGAASRTDAQSGHVQSRTGTRNRSQREEVGGRREEEIESSNELSLGAPPKPRPGLADLKAADFLDYARQRAPCAKVDLELEKFRNWSRQNGKRHKDAAAGFRNWLIKADEIARERGERPPAQANGARPKRDASQYSDDDWRLAIRSFENAHKSEHGGVWYAAWGAQPLKGRFAEGCLVPKRIQREFGYGAPDGGNSDVSTRAQGEKP